MKPFKGKAKNIFRFAAAGLVAAPLAFSAAAMAQEADGAAPDDQPVTSEQVTQENSGTSNDVSYLYPLALAGLGSLPLLWWLLRSTPPRPREYDFPAVRILGDVDSTEETPAKTPPWQLMMRMTIGAAAITAMAQPLINQNEPLIGEGPLVLVVDNGWASAPNWEMRQQEIESRLNMAEREGRQVIVIPTAPPEDGGVVRASDLLNAEEARTLTQTLQPRPWAVDREAALRALEGVEGPVSAVWMSNGLSDEHAQALAERLEALGTLTVMRDSPADGPMVLLPPDNSGGSLSVTVRRMSGETEETVGVAARAEDGRLIERAEITFEAGETETSAVFDLPPEIRNQLTRISIEGENSAGAIVLLDERWRQRPVGIVDSSAPEPGDPLLDDSYYVEQALEPYTDLHQGTLDELLDQNMAVMVLTDTVDLNDNEQQRLDEWIRNGGTVLRFAGTNMAEEPDDLLPVRLVPGDRNLGGAMSWSEPEELAPFAPGSPFYGLELPDNVTVERQVLAQSGIELAERTWARLEDGTPLVTAEQRGKGLLVLVHTTPDPSWSNLALSGLFVDMLQTVVSRSEGVTAGLDEDTALQPWKTVDGMGRLGDPPASTGTLTAEILNQNAVGPRTPPGFYGTENGRKALNLTENLPAFSPLEELPAEAISEVYTGAQEKNLTGPLLTGALGLLIVDLLLVMGQRGMLPGAGGPGNGAHRRRDNSAAAPKAAAPNP